MDSRRPIDAGRRWGKGYPRILNGLPDEYPATEWIAGPRLLLDKDLGQQHPQAEQGGKDGAGGDDFHSSFRSSKLMLASSMAGKCCQQFAKLLILCYILATSGPLPFPSTWQTNPTGMNRAAGRIHPSRPRLLLDKDLGHQHPQAEQTEESAGGDQGFHNWHPPDD